MQMTSILPVSIKERLSSFTDYLCVDYHPSMSTKYLFSLFENNFLCFDIVWLYLRNDCIIDKFDTKFVLPFAECNFN